MDLFVIAVGLAVLPFAAAAGIAMTAGRRFSTSGGSKRQVVEAHVDLAIPDVSIYAPVLNKEKVQA